jgi:hypothetical protein
MARYVYFTQDRSDAAEAQGGCDRGKDKRVKVLIGCEFSGTVREAFKARGHDAWSCDLLPTEIPGNHLQCDVLEVLGENWDLAIFHPPCTHLAVSGAAHFHRKKREQFDALYFVRRLLESPIARIAVENPVSVISSYIRKPDQIIQPWMFGHTEQKTTCLWLKNLPKLVATKNVKAEMDLLPKNQRERLHYLPPSPDRWKLRSKTFQGISVAMADQWTNQL